MRIGQTLEMALPPPIGEHIRWELINGRTHSPGGRYPLGPESSKIHPLQVDPNASTPQSSATQIASGCNYQQEKHNIRPTPVDHRPCLDAQDSQAIAALLVMLQDFPLAQTLPRIVRHPCNCGDLRPRWLLARSALRLGSPLHKTTKRHSNGTYLDQLFAHHNTAFHNVTSARLQQVCCAMQKQFSPAPPHQRDGEPKDFLFACEDRSHRGVCPFLVGQWDFLNWETLGRWTLAPVPEAAPSNSIRVLKISIGKGNGWWSLDLDQITECE